MYNRYGVLFGNLICHTYTNHNIWSDKKIIGIADDSGLLLARFIYGSKEHVPDYMITDTAEYMIVTNHLGSPVQVVDVNSGVVIQEIKYNVWGEIISDTNPGFQPFGFAGCLYDQDTKLCRFGVRDYDPSIGRWLSKDPILFNGGDANLYGYVLQDPVNLVDPSGRSAVGIGDFFKDVGDFVDGMDDWSDYLEWIRRNGMCKINPDQCGKDPSEEPFKNDDFTNDDPNPSNGPKGCM